MSCAFSGFRVVTMYISRCLILKSQQFSLTGKVKVLRSLIHNVEESLLLQIMKVDTQH